MVAIVVVFMSQYILSKVYCCRKHFGQGLGMGVWLIKITFIKRVVGPVYSIICVLKMISNALLISRNLHLFEPHVEDVDHVMKVWCIWATAWQNQHNGMCAQQRLRSAWASAQSDQSSLCAQWVAKDPSFLHTDSEDSDETGRMPRLRGARWLSGRVSDSGARGRGFDTYRRRVVSLSKTLYSPKVLVNYPGSGGSVPTWLKNCWLGR